MKKIISAMLVFLLVSSSAQAACSYRMQKKMLHNRRVVKKKVINAQIKGKMLAIQELSRKDYCNDPKTKQKILAYQNQIVDLTNQKLCLKKEYKASLAKLKAAR